MGMECSQSAQFIVWAERKVTFTRCQTTATADYSKGINWISCDISCLHRNSKISTRMSTTPPTDTLMINGSSS